MASPAQYKECGRTEIYVRCLSYPSQSMGPWL